ncbi:hypothetical protein SCUCBS95973_000679 [Sporothrix curviconia]|uniref:Chitin-binding type-1 domain-containing protein n=1 Tax=Sporothrix curviconia TaxID=1260050 RepID=A0ABP0AS88_9PEZI
MTLLAGESIDLSWTGGMTGNTTADLWVAAYAYGVDDTFSQLLTKQVDLAVDGTFNWTVDIPQPQLDATPNYVLIFKTAARDDFRFDASDPGLPSPGISVIENDGDGLAVDNGTDGFVDGTGTSAASATTSSSDSSSSDIFGDDSDDGDDGDDGDDSDDDDDGNDGDDGDDGSSSTGGSSAGSSTSPASIPDGFTTTVNATCGGTLTCIGSVFGDCCSQHNFCGSTDDYCGSGCLPAFGNCDSTLPTSTATSMPTATSTPKPMSIAAMAGIATGVSVSVIALFLAGWFGMRRRSSSVRRQRSQQQAFQQQQNMLGGVSGNYLGDGSSAVFYNGRDSAGAVAATAKQRPYLMLETGRNGPMSVYGHSVAKSIDTSRGSPDRMYAGNQRPQTSSSTVVGTPHPTSATVASMASVYPTPPPPPPPVPPLQQAQQRGQQERVFEMEGGENPFHYGQSPPAELDGGSPVHERER